MAKEIAIGKRAKISEAQQHILLAVLGASIFLGAGVSLTSHFIQQISFNAKVIAEEEKSIVSYSDTIRDIGICVKPNGTIYSDAELDKCNPNDIEISQIPDTLRANILEKLASNKALNSVPKEDDNTNCINISTGKNYTYKELSKIYSDARGAEQLQSASQLIKSCSALRVIPDALPSFKNEEALLSSLNKIYNISNWEPESINSNGSIEESSVAEAINLNEISFSSTIEADSGTVMRVLNNIERSIREFDIKRANIEWSNNNSLSFQFQATAYYMDKSNITESTKTITQESE